MKKFALLALLPLALSINACTSNIGANDYSTSGVRQVGRAMGCTVLSVRQVVVRSDNNVGMIAGSYVTDGKVTRNAQIRVIRDGVIIFEDKIASLRRFKDDVREVASGYECGIGLDKFNDIKEKDVLEAYTMEQIER